MAIDPAPRPASWRLAAWLGFVLVFTTLAYVSRIQGYEPPEDAAYRYSSSVGAVVQYALILGILLLVAKGLPYREVFALRRPSSWPRALGFAGAGFVTIWVVSGILYGVFSLVDLDATEEQGLVPDEWDSARLGAFVAFFAAVTFVGPLIEELAYRGLGFSLLAPYGVWVAITATALLFGLSHGLLVALPILTAFGAVLGWLRARMDSIYPSVVLHAAFNGVTLLLAVTVGG